MILGPTGMPITIYMIWSWVCEGSISPVDREFVISSVSIASGPRAVRFLKMWIIHRSYPAVYLH